MAPQMINGHVLDQGVYDEHFEAGTDKLTPGGQEHLKYLARRRPQPHRQPDTQSLRTPADGSTVTGRYTGRHPGGVQPTPSSHQRRPLGADRRAHR